MEDKKQQLKELLKIHYGFKDFRPGQEKAIDNILAGKNTVVVMPTGGGKSLIYQLPSLVLEGATIVVSPLISLMKDQVDSLALIGINATFINSTISPNEAQERLNSVQEGRFKILYIAPERFYNQNFLEVLKNIKVSLFAVDEAHCISQWGHDFRPSYMKLKNAVEYVGKPPVAALTATATPEVREDIVKQLNLDNPEVVVTGFARPNLQFGVIQAKDAQKNRLIIDAIGGASDGAGIIYVGTRNKGNDLTQLLLDNGIDASVYHAGMDPEDRKAVQEDFMKNKVKVIVATNAFGLGINKSDIRFVIHYDMPGTIEAYYQEAGRAGRDGKPSFCLLFYSPRDRYLQEFFIKGDNPPPEIVEEIYDVLLSYESDSVLITYSQLNEMISDNLPEMAIGTSLKILEREGYISRPNEKVGQAFLQLTDSFSSALDTLGARAKKQIEVLTKLNDRWGNDLIDGFSFNPEEVAEMLDIKKETLMRTIRKLADEGAFKYNPPFRGTEINILKKADSGNLKIDFSAMKKKASSAYDKLDKIEDYVYHFNCRQKFILDYFGDSDSTNCKKCDNCLTGGRSYQPREKKEKFSKPDYKNFKKHKEDGFDVSPPEKRSGLNTKLTQLETLDFFKQGLSTEEIAEQRNLKPATINTHLSFLIEKKLIKNIDKLVPKNKQAKINKIIEKIGAEKLTPLKEELGDDFSWEEIRFAVAFKKSQK